MRRGFVEVTVTAVHVETGGHFIEGEIEPLGVPITARVASRPGFYWPIAVGEVWAVALPTGEGATEPLALSPVWSAAAPPPAEAVADPDRVWIVTSGDVHVKAGGRVVQEAPLIEHGERDLDPTLGVVHGQAVDTFTGATFSALGSASTVVRVKKA